MRWIGLLIAMAGVAVATGLGGSSWSFISVPSMVFVLFVGCGVVVASHGVSVWRVLAQALRGPIDEALARRARSAAETGKQAFVAAGWIGVLIGIVQMFSTLDDPSKIGVGAATALLTVFYGYILAYVFCMPLERSLADQTNAA